MFPLLWPSRRRGLYERVADTDAEAEELSRSRFRSNLALAAVSGLCVAFLLIFKTAIEGNPPHFLRTNQAATIQKELASPSSSHEHTQPTRFSIVDHTTNKYLSASENPLYHRLNALSEFHRYYPDRRRKLSHQDDWVEPPTLTLDRTELGPDVRHEPLTVSWTGGRKKIGRTILDASSYGDILSGKELLLVYCGLTKLHPLSLELVEVATLEQLEATTRKHHGHHVPGQWYIPSFPMTRHDQCIFQIFDALSSVVLAESPLLHIPGASKIPTSIHLSWSNDPSEVVVMFTTGEAGTPVALYGKKGTPSSQWVKVEGESHTYKASDMCEAPANSTKPLGEFVDPGQLHVIRLTGLAPNTAYSYQVGLASGQGIVWSRTKHTFQSAPRVGDASAVPFSFVAYGDQGCPSNGWGDGAAWTTAMAIREATKARAVHHFGDLSYAQGVAHIWDDWFEMIEPFAASLPLMIGVGNHEYDHTGGGGNGKDPSGDLTDEGFHPDWGNFHTDSGGECGVPTSNRFTMPTSTAGNFTSNGVFWYSHDFGLVHTIMLSSEHNLTVGSPQYQWLEADLKSVNRSVTPWLVVEAHRPMYESQAYWENTAVGIAMRYEIEDLLYQYQVDAMLAGHYHAYLRTCDGLYQSQCNNGGPIHITIGSAGAVLNQNSVLYQQEWTERFIPLQFGYGRLTICNATTLHWEFVKAGADNDTDAGKTLDEKWVVRKRD